MVIGNGFFSASISDALQEMEQRSGCEVKRLPFSTIGNIEYYISCNGDLYGVQHIADRVITRKKRHQRYKRGFTARLSYDAHRELFVHLENLVYSAFIANEYLPDIELQFKNGNPYDVRPENLFIRPDTNKQRYRDTMMKYVCVYASCFIRFCYSCQYHTGIDIDDSKDIVSQTFIYLCTDGHNPSIKTEDDFAGLWYKLSQMRCVDFLRHRWLNVYGEEENLESRSRVSYEIDLFALLKGEKRKQYMKMYFEGNKPTEIAKHFGFSLGAVSSEVTRGVQYLRNYLKGEKPYE